MPAPNGPGTASGAGGAGTAGTAGGTPSASAREAEAVAQRTVRVREKVMMTLESAFHEVFRGSETKLVPIMNHRAVHLKLVEWDQLQMALESIEVRHTLSTNRGWRGQSPELWPR